MKLSANGVESMRQAQRFFSCHGVVNNLFRLGRHLLKAKHYRAFRNRSFAEWDRVSCIQNLGQGVFKGTVNLATPQPLMR